MNINWKPNYIPGDLVYNHKGEVIRITSSYLKGTRLFYYKTDEIGESTGCILEEALKPIPLTPEILEKNGWKKPDGFDSYWLGKIGLLRYDEVWQSAVGSTRLAIILHDIQYVHQLQHILFSLGINHEMEV